jgi:hypothetical protein
MAMIGGMFNNDLLLLTVQLLNKDVERNESG